MNESIISVRYTKALFNLAREKDLLDLVKADMEYVFNLMGKSKDLQMVFQNPVLKPSHKKEIIQQIFGSFNKVTISFINILIENRREEFLHDISRNFLSRYKQFKGIEQGTFITAFAVDKKVLDKVKTTIQQVLKTDSEITNEVNPNIIGGFILRVGDKQFDASIESNLNKIKRKLLNTTVN